MIKSVGFKTIRQRTVFVIMGVVLVILINFLIFWGILIAGHSRVFWGLFLILLVLWWEWYRWLRVWRNTFYAYDKKWLTIINFRKKQIFVPREKIEAVEELKLSHLWTPNWWFRQKEEGLYVLTSTDKVIRISLKWGENIYISPRKNLFGNKWNDFFD